MNFRFGTLSLLLAFSFFPLTSPADDLCSRDEASLLARAHAPEERISLRNGGGFFGASGVCWWHSRFQRAVWHLVRYAPEAPKPSHEKAKALIHTIAHVNGVVTIPGYRDFHSFSIDFEDLIQKELNQWQARDSFINQDWIRGLRGRSVYRDAAVLEAKMDGVYRAHLESQKNGEILWVMMQMKGVVAHAALVLGMVDTGEGYSLSVVDSSFPGETNAIHYRRGDHTLYADYAKHHDQKAVRQLYRDGFTLNPGYGRDYRKMRDAIAEYCASPRN